MLKLAHILLLLTSKRASKPCVAHSDKIWPQDMGKAACGGAAMCVTTTRAAVHSPSCTQLLSQAGEILAVKASLRLTNIFVVAGEIISVAAWMGAGAGRVGSAKRKSSASWAVIPIQGCGGLL